MFIVCKISAFDVCVYFLWISAHTARGGNSIHCGHGKLSGGKLLAVARMGDEGLGLRALLTGVGGVDFGGQLRSGEIFSNGFHLLVRYAWLILETFLHYWYTASATKN
jgi:hypothetical protein